MMRCKMKLFYWKKAVVLLIICLVPLVGQVREHPHIVESKLNDCEFISVPEFDRILQLEIQSNIASHRNIAKRKTLLEVTCMPNFVALNAQDTERGIFSKRRVRINTESTEGKERVIAIAATELVLSAWEHLFVQAREGTSFKKADAADELSLKPKLSNKSDEHINVASVSSSNSLRKKRRSAALGLSALWRVYPNRKTSLFGGELGGSIGLMGPFQLHFAVATEGGRVNRSIGRISLFLASAMLSISVHRRLFISSLQGWVHIGFRSGYGKQIGNSTLLSSLGHSLSGYVGGPLLRFSIASTTRPAIGGSLEMGTTIFGISGQVEGESSVDMRGFWMCIMLDLIVQRKLHTR